MTDSKDSLQMVQNWDDVIANLTFTFSSKTLSVFSSKHKIEIEGSIEQREYEFRSLADLNGYLEIIFSEKNISASFETRESQRGILIRMNPALIAFIKSFNPSSIQFDDAQHTAFASGPKAIPQLLTLIEASWYQKKPPTPEPTQKKPDASIISELTAAIQSEATKLEKGSLSFFAINKRKKSRMIEDALTNVKSFAGTKTMKPEEFLDYKKDSKSKSLREALNYNRLFIHKEKTNTLIAVEKALHMMTK